MDQLLQKVYWCGSKVTLMVVLLGVITGISGVEGHRLIDIRSCHGRALWKRDDSSPRQVEMAAWMREELMFINIPESWSAQSLSAHWNVVWASSFPCCNQEEKSTRKEKTQVLIR